MKCYACEKIPEYSCSCSSPMFLICHDDLKSHIEDTTKKHNLKIWDYPEETSLYLHTREVLMNIIAELLSETKAKLFEIKKSSKEKIDHINNLARELDEKFKAKSLNKHTIENVISHLKGIKNFDGDRSIEENKSNSLLETATSNLNLEPNQPYALKNVSSGEYLYVSNDEKGGDKVLESRSNFLDCCVFFFTKTEDGFALKNATLVIYIFLAEKDRIGGDRIVEASSKISPKSFFKIYYREGKSFALQNIKFGEWLFLSNDRLPGGRVVEAKNELEERSYFEFIKTCSA